MPNIPKSVDSMPHTYGVLAADRKHVESFQSLDAARAWRNANAPRHGIVVSWQRRSGEALKTERVPE